MPFFFRVAEASGRDLPVLVWTHVPRLLQRHTFVIVCSLLFLPGAKTIKPDWYLRYLFSYTAFHTQTLMDQVQTTPRSKSSRPKHVCRVNCEIRDVAPEAHPTPGLGTAFGATGGAATRGGRSPNEKRPLLKRPRGMRVALSLEELNAHRGRHCGV